MTSFKDLFDTYERKARIYPGLIVIAPAIIVCYLWYPSLRSIGGTIGGLIVTLGVPMLLATFVRKSGKRLEKKLIEKWGALPSTIMLRHRDQTIDPTTKKRYHKFLSDNIPDMVIPTPEQELNDPAYADEIYASSVKWMLARTRDRSKFGLVFTQNVHYGFSRNLRGMKYWGLFVSGITFIAVGYALYHEYNWNLTVIPAEKLVSALIPIAFFFAWIFVVTIKWVRTTADAFASELIASCDIAP